MRLLDISFYTDTTMNTSTLRLKALAEPTRLRILGFLEAEELAVGELTALLGMAQSRVSAHLGVLRDAGFVQDRRQGTSVYYALGEGPAVETWKTLARSDPSLALGAPDRRRLARALRQRRERSREFFDRAAASWDAGRSESLGLEAGGLALAGLLPRNLVVLDLGTGTGGLLPLLGRHLDRVVAVDGSHGMLARASERVRQTGARAVDLLRADVESIPVSDGSVDGVVANMILHHLPEPSRLFREMARVLRPGGRGVVVDFEAHDAAWLLTEEGHRWPGFEPDAVRDYCRRAGLTDPEFERVTTPKKGRWSRLTVFVARFERASGSQRSRDRSRTHATSRGSAPKTPSRRASKET
jgi:DNA-binding transcriptional ArsR family regulator/SAM-dependent methyltransferase